MPQHFMRRTGLHPNASRTARKLGHWRGYSIRATSRSTVLAEHVPKPEADERTRIAAMAYDIHAEFGAGGNSSGWLRSDRRR